MIEFCTAQPPNKHLQPTAANVACGSVVASLLAAAEVIVRLHEFTHLAWVSLAMAKNEMSNPVPVVLLRAQRVMFEPHPFAQLISRPKVGIRHQ